MYRAIHASAKSAAIVAGFAFAAECAYTQLSYRPSTASPAEALALLNFGLMFAIVVMPIGYVVGLSATCMFGLPLFLMLHTFGLRPMLVRAACGLVGFSVGTMIWRAIFYSDTSIHIGWWGTALIVGGLAGAAGGMAFARTALSDRGL